jgi:hypothetical protein
MGFILGVGRDQEHQAVDIPFQDLGTCSKLSLRAGQSDCCRPDMSIPFVGYNVDHASQWITSPLLGVEKSDNITHLDITAYT